MLRNTFPIQTAEAWYAFENAVRKSPGSKKPECILEGRELSIRGELTRSDIREFQKKSIDLGVPVTLSWNRLPTENQFQDQAECFRDLWNDSFSAIRVQDPGVFHHVVQDHDVHLMLETGNHNLPAVEAMLHHGSPKVKRVVLSNEVPLLTLKHWCSQLSIATEIVALGPLLIFYSPRHLLSPQIETQGILERKGISEEDGRAFTFIENDSGTLMYLDKTLFLLDRMDLIQEAGITHVSLDANHLKGKKPMETWFRVLVGFQEAHHIEELKNSLGTGITRGFSSANKTDRQFKHLKNTRLRARLPLANAQVLQTVQKKYLVIVTCKELEAGKPYLFATPDGRESIVKLAWFQKPWSVKTKRTDAKGTWLCPHVSGASSGTLILDPVPQ
jgi:putative protease